jgi:hypothetical protein
LMHSFRQVALVVEIGKCHDPAPATSLS